MLIVIQTKNISTFHTMAHAHVYIRSGDIQAFVASHTCIPVPN